MKLLHVLAFTLCLPAPFAYATSQPIQIGTATAGVVIDSAALNAIAQRLIERGVYAGLGTVLALCGCYLLTLGVKRIWTEKDKFPSSFGLASSGLAIIVGGVDVATNTTRESK